ncbi:DUF3492 domain-containing protein [Peterkaempfera sp. SMS 1(5)a]|uniref:DUF3492 domain-containing protein n=1 Tax=Peterkaempfera podocarpi TaxID=3232308 RepID=UPI00366C1434
MEVVVRIALLTESADPHAMSGGPVPGPVRVPGSDQWCDWLARALPECTFQRFAADDTGGARRRSGRGPRGRRRSRCLQYYGALVRALADPRESDSFPTALYALAEATCEPGALPALLASDAAQQVLEQAWRESGGSGAESTVREQLAAGEALERCLRPLSAAWCRVDAPATDICHLVGGGTAALPALLARRLHGVPFVVGDHRVALRQRYADHRAERQHGPVRALELSFLRLLAQETYRQAAFVLPGSEYDRWWLERCGAPPERIRVVREGLADSPAGRPEEVLPEPEALTLLWARTPGEACDPAAVRAALALVRSEVPEVELQLYDTAAAAPSTPGAPRTAPRRGCAAGSVLLLPAPVDPGPLIEAMLSGRPVIAGDLGAARETVGPAGLLVAPGDSHALAEACVALLRDPERRARLGTAGRQRVQELHSAEGAAEALRSVYLDVVSRWPAFPSAGGRAAQPFSRPAEFWAAEDPVPERTVA